MGHVGGSCGASLASDREWRQVYGEDATLPARRETDCASAREIQIQSRLDSRGHGV